MEYTKVEVRRPYPKARPFFGIDYTYAEKRTRVGRDGFDSGGHKHVLINAGHFSMQLDATQINFIERIPQEQKGS